MRDISKPAPFKKWIRPVIYINTLVVVGAFCFYLGAVTADCNIHKISEVHFIDRKLLHGNVEPSIISYYEGLVINKLKQARPPYTEKELTDTIQNAYKGVNLNKYFKVIKADSISYKIIVDDSNAAILHLITTGQVYYLKPLKIVNDLKLNN